MHRLISNSMTGALRLAVDVDFAGGQWKDLPDDLQCIAQRTGRRVGSIVERPVLLHAPDNREARKIFFDGQAQIGILLVVAQDDIESRAVTLDQVAFEDQGFENGPGDDGFEIGDLVDEQAGFWRLVAALLKIGADPVSQIQRLCRRTESPSCHS